MKPRPGTAEAIAAGCTCGPPGAIVDEYLRDNGFSDDERAEVMHSLLTHLTEALSDVPFGEGSYWYSLHCPLHGGER